MNYNNEIFFPYKKQLLQKKIIFFNTNYKNEIFLAYKKTSFFANFDILYLIGIIKIKFFINKEQFFYWIDLKIFRLKNYNF